MRKSGFSWLILAIFALALPVRAAATPEPMPKQIEAHISARSILGLLENVDTYVAAATKGTPKAVPPGFIGMMAQIYLPIPLDTWDSDGEIHFIVLRSEDAKEPAPANTVAVFGAPDFAALSESLEERNWIAGEIIDDAGYEAVQPFVLPNGVSLVLADLGDGRVAAALSHEKIAAALEGWTPAHASGSDIVVNMALNADGGILGRTAMQRLEREKDDILEAIAGAGIKPEVAENIISTVEKYLPLVTDEIGNLRNVVMEIGFDGETMLFDLVVRPGAGTLLGEIGESLSSAKSVDFSIAEGLPAGAVSAAVSARMSDVIPAAKSRAVKWAANFYGGMLPEFRERMAGLVADVLDSDPGQTAMSNYLVDGRQYSLSINRPANPEKTVTAIMSILGTINDMWAASLAEPAYGLEFVGEERETDGVAYVVYRLVFADPARFQELLDGFADGDRDLSFDIAMLSRMRFYLSVLDGALVSASGELSDEEFLARFAEMKAPSGNSLIATEQAKKTLAGLPNAQASAGVFDAGGISGIYALQKIRAAKSQYGEDGVKRMVAAVADHLKNRKSNGEVAGFSLGGENGWLNMRCLIPGGVISQVMRDLDGFDRVKKSARPLPEPAPEPDEYEDDLEEEDVADEDSDAA